MTLETFTRLALAPGLSLLPGRMDTREARVLLMAICIQESGLRHRRQLGGGPARGYAQFETAGVQGVLTHRASSEHAVRVCCELDVEPTTPAVHAALEHHDALTVCMARLLLWTLPAPLPAVDATAGAWDQYIAAWRPGRPRPEHWPQSHGAALGAVT